MKKALLMLNPRSGVKGAKNNFFSIVNALSDSYELTLHLTKSSQDIIYTASKCEFDTVIVCGGDGTLSHTVEGLLKGGKTKTAIGYIPCGTANDVANTLKLPSKPALAAQKICEGTATPHDVCTFNGRHFIYTASFGTFTKASYETSQDLKNIFGNAAYFFGGVGEFLKMAEVEADIEWEGGILREKNIAFCAVGNTRSLGGGFVKFDEKNAVLDDGKADLLIVRKPKNIVDLEKAISEIVSGKFNNEMVTLLHSDKFRIKTASQILWTIDGEGFNAPCEVEIGCLNKAINFIL